MQQRAPRASDEAIGDLIDHAVDLTVRFLSDRADLTASAAFALNRLHRTEEFARQVTTMTDLLAKQISTSLFEDRLLPKQRVLLEPVRMRHALDSFDHLRTTELLPAAILPRGALPGLDFVLHKSQARALRHLKYVHNRPIYVRLPGGEEVRCLLQRLFISPDKQTYLKATLARYVVGEPNAITVRLVVNERFHPAQRLAEVELMHEEIDLISYNDVNPVEIELDYNRLCRKKRYTLGDLCNTLPPGLEPHPRYKSLHYQLAKVVHAPTRIESDAEHLLESETGVFEEEARDAEALESLTTIASEEQWERTRTLATERRREARRALLAALQQRVQPLAPPRQPQLGHHAPAVEYRQLGAVGPRRLAAEALR